MIVSEYDIDFNKSRDVGSQTIRILIEFNEHSISIRMKLVSHSVRNELPK